MKYVLLAFLLISCSEKHASPPPVERETPRAEIGRYQLITKMPHINKSVLLDTVTGNMWEDTCYKPNPKAQNGCDVSAWSKADIVDINTTKKEVYELVEYAEKKK